MAERNRYYSADLLRGLAILVMIEVHVFNAFLSPEFSNSKWFSILNFINGLVAPSFLFVSGFAFQVSSNSKLDVMRQIGKPFWKKISRMFQIILIGYALHIPFFSLSRILNNSNPKLLSDFFAVDVLQCIGVSLLFLFLLRLLIKSDTFYHYILIATLLFVMIFSPFAWQINFTNWLHPFLANYFNRLNGSLFPIFPWINFILAGAIFAKYFVESRLSGNEEAFIKKTAFVGLGLLIFGHLFFSNFIPIQLRNILPHPIFYLERLGYVLVLFVVCWFWDKKLTSGKSFVLKASSESLLIYWLHLIIIYRQFNDGIGLANGIGKTLGLVEVIIATIILVVLMLIAANIWHWAKKEYPKQSSLFVKISVGIVIIIFALK